MRIKIWAILILQRLAWSRGKKFKYLFGFGECWLFQYRVLKVVDKNTEKPFVIKPTGGAPMQYPDMDI